MKENKITGKILEEYNDVFADIYNTLVFGKEFLDETKLESGSTESLYNAENGEQKEQMRNVLKSYKNMDLVLCSIGMENQPTIDDSLPIDIMGYESSLYYNQLDKSGELHMVATIVLNFSDKRWDKPKNLHGLMDISEKIRPFIQDYNITVFDIAFLEDEVIEKFTSDFKFIAGFFKAKRVGNAKEWLSGQKMNIKHKEAVMEMLKAFSKDNIYTDVYNNYFRENVEE